MDRNSFESEAKGHQPEPAFGWRAFEPHGATLLPHQSQLLLLAHTIHPFATRSHLSIHYSRSSFAGTALTSRNDLCLEPSLRLHGVYWWWSRQHNLFQARKKLEQPQKGVSESIDIIRDFNWDQVGGYYSALGILQRLQDIAGRQQQQSVSKTTTQFPVAFYGAGPKRPNDSSSRVQSNLPSRCSAACTRANLIAADGCLPALETRASFVVEEIPKEQ